MAQQETCQCRRHKRCEFDPWVRKIPSGRAWQPAPVFLPGASHGQKSLAGCSPQGHKELDTIEQMTLPLFSLGCLSIPFHCLNAAHGSQETFSAHSLLSVLFCLVKSCRTCPMPATCDSPLSTDTVLSFSHNSHALY